MANEVDPGTGSRLLVDLGGTNTRCALQQSGDDPHIVRKVKNRGYDGLEQVLRQYLDDLPRDWRPRVAALAVAAPVGGDEVRLTNLGWEFSTEALRGALGLEKLVVVNDFTAIAMALPWLPRESLVKIGPGEPVAGRALAVLGPGTGLGVSGLLPAGERWIPLSGEGGHVTLPATDDREAAVIAMIRQRQGHVSAERLVSGAGLTNLYAALKTLAGGVADQTATPERISQLADEGDEIAREARGLFFDFLGTVAGNLAMSLGALGGVYVAGGIVPKMREAFAASDFRAKFEAKGRYREYMASIPTWLVMEPVPAFRGLAAILDGRMI
jgi:glucokinase